MDHFQSLSLSVFYGLKDSITGIFAIRLITYKDHGDEGRTRISRRSTKTFQKILQLCLLNGGIFWLSLVFFDSILLPCLYSFLRLLFGSRTSLLNSVWYWTEPILSHTFNALWRLPVFFVTRIVNALWFQDIADSTYQGRPIISKGVASTIADTLFSLVIQALFLLQSLVIASIPISPLGMFASLFHLSLLYSLYSFEYKWVNIGWELHKRLQYIENTWPYFLGFGLPLALLTSISQSYFVNGCIFSLLFPLFIISSNEAKPRRSSRDFPIRIFKLVVWLSNKLFQRAYSSFYRTASLRMSNFS